MVVGEPSIHNIMGGMESTGGVRLHNHKRKLKQRFDIIKKLGQGTYGKVQLGINKETGQEVAIKTIKKCKIETEADLIRIRREIQIMSSVQHPNIIHIYEVFENREKMVLVMEYAAGGELYDYLSERKVLSEHEARRIFRQIATAVFYCHKHKICHRDLKLENILLDQVGNAKIADFGLSNVFGEQRLLSTFCGSPLYASPEIVKGTPYHGPEVDCWSLGVLLYTLVYGAMPFDGSNFKRLVKQISQSDYFEPKKPSPASPLIKEMLTVCPGRRADVERICTHWWVNEGYEQNCLDIAEDLAAQTPVRLDLLLSLVPQSASAEKLLVGDQQAGGDVANNMSSETLVPTRCHSVGSLMELDQNSSDRRIRELFDEEPRSSAAGGDAKRKLETTPSMDETAAAGVKRKERSRRKERSDEREPRAYRSSSRHHSAPIPNSISEEAMEVEPAAGIVTVPTSKTVDLDRIEGAAACLELIEESKERSLSKERCQTPPVDEYEEPREPMSAESAQQIYEPNQKVSNVEDMSLQKYTKSPSNSFYEDVGGNASESSSNNNNNNNNKIAHETTQPSKKSESAFESKVPNESDTNSVRNEAYLPRDTQQQSEPTEGDFKKLKEKALSLDSELSNEAACPPAKPVERRRSKIFETAEKFNQLTSTADSEKPKKIFIPGVNVGGAKRAFERKASLSSITAPPPAKASASKMIIDVPTEKKSETNEKQQQQATSEQTMAAADDKSDNKRDEAKKRAVDIITGAIGKPPMQRKPMNGSPPISPQSSDSKKLGLKIQVAPNDVRSATVSVSTPVETKFGFDTKSSPAALEATITSASNTATGDRSQLEEPKMSSKMEITLKSATLPRRKTSKAEITLAGAKPPETVAFKSEVEAKIDAFQPQKLRTQRSEVAFPVAAAVPQANRSSSLEPESRPKAAAPRERIIPIQVETEPEHVLQHSSTSPPKPPMSQRSMSQRSSSLSRQSTADSDTDSALGSTVGPEPIRKSPREYIIPIAVEGGGYVTPRSGSLEPESKTSTPTSANPPRSRFGRPRRMSSLLSDASEDESPFSSLHSEDLLQRHMHRLRSSRPSRQPSEHADSLSSGEDDDDDGFELLTAENLFSTLLSRVRSLTQRLNVDDNRPGGFPSSRLFGRLGAQPSQAFWGLNKPLSRRLSESQFKHSLSRDADIFSKRDSASTSNPGTPNSPGSHGTPSRESVFEIGSNTLPRDKVETHEDVEAAETAQVRKETQESLEQSFTPSLARRLSRQLIEQTRQSLPRDKYYQSPTRETLSLMASTGEVAKRHSASASSDQTEYRGRSVDRGIRRANSLLEPAKQFERFERHSPRRSISLFDDHEEHGLLPPLPRHIMTLGRKYKESGGGVSVGNARRDNFHGYRAAADKIQEEPLVLDEASYGPCKEEDTDADNNGSVSETTTSISMCNSNANLMDTTTTSSVSAKSCETSPTESSSNLGDYGKSFSTTSKSDAASRSFETRLLAAENLIKESKLKNLTPQRFNPNLISHYKDTDKCDKEALITNNNNNKNNNNSSSSTGATTSATASSATEQSANSVASKRRSCIPSLRLRSGSLTRESSVSSDRRKSFAGSPDALVSVSRERSILSKFFRGGGGGGNNNNKDEPKDNKSQKQPKQHRISRFLRPDFFDTPREESQYVKEKEAQKAAENERRKSRFMRRKSESKDRKEEERKDERICKEQKDEINTLQKGKSLEATASSEDRSQNEDKERVKIERQGSGSKSSFLHLLERKLERLRSSDETTTKQPTMNGDAVPVAIGERKERRLRENSAPPVECPSPTEPANCGLLKRALSVEDLPLSKDKVKSTSKTGGRVTSVLGIFKSGDAKLNANSRVQSTIVSKLKRSPPKCAKTELEEDAVATTKIPTTKFAGKLTKSKAPESGKKSPEKIASEYKRSPPKEKSKESISKEKKSTVEKQTKEMKRAPEKMAQSDSSVEKMKALEKAEPPRKLSGESEYPQRDNKHAAESVMSGEDKKLLKTKKNISSLSKNESVTKIDRGDDADKKTKKPAKPKEAADKDEINGTKKKKIVRVVRKVVKKSSDSSESKSDEKEKTSSRPSLLRKKIITTKKEKSPEVGNPVPVQSSTNRGNNVDNQTSPVKSPSRQANLEPSSDVLQSRETSSARLPVDYSVQNTNSVPKSDTLTSHTAASKSSARMTAVDSSQTNSVLQNVSSSASSAQSSSGPVARNASNSNVSQTRISEQSRPNRASLKLDLSKIPQHTFRHTTPKRDSPKSDSPRASSSVCVESPKTDAPACEADADKLLECLSKMTYHANITGNKIVIDKPLRAKDVAELKREVTECARIIENHIESRNDRSSPQQPVVEPIVAESTQNKDIEKTLPREIFPADPSREVNETDNVAKDPVEDSISEMFSPEEPESFDSWSICSADLNHNRSDLHSPTSPSYSLLARGDSSESVIDRIRRRSFYSSVTLPRRSSFNSSREWARSRLYSYGVPRTRADKSYGLYGDDMKSPVDRERYSDSLNASSSSYDHHSPEARSIFDHYGSLPSSSHDSLRKYVRSPTLDLATARAKYHSTDIITDNDIVNSYKSPLSRSSLNDAVADSYRSRSISATLPRRKYGSTVGSLAPKSVEYYEEILSPSNPDYLSPRDICRSPLLDGYLSRYENGYHHNGNLDLPQYSTDKQRSYTDKMADVEVGEENDRSLGEQKRNMKQRLSEARDMSSTTTDVLPNLSVAEQKQYLSDGKYGWFNVPLVPLSKDPRLRFPRRQVDFIAVEVSRRRQYGGLPEEKFTGVPFKT
ncbi:NUAK family SNF1-like kinase 1 [Harpegnathos saltator]|uniref:NUAK family SNF1-like kinase 1 n=1 Tax=Harpegnathos saltator TaxID=610380 RepID=E2BX60_HARSA|nr:NUAK family SNF1-like kinase 1 [Harpegnathos saltator]